MPFLDLKYLTFFFFLSIFHSLFTISFFLFLITYYFFPFSYFFSCTSMPSALSLHSQLNKWIILSERFPSFLRTSQNLLIYYIPYIFISLLLLSLFLIFHKDNSTIDRFYHNIKMFPMHCSVFFSVFFDAWTLNAVIRNRSVRGHWLGTAVDLLLINNKHKKCSKPILFGGNLALFFSVRCPFQSRH